MIKKFDNVADGGVEKAIRRGFTVPNGAVNLAWAKAPALNPANNITVIDTSRVISENQSLSAKTKKIAFANALGILEDEDGNEIWDEEYPIVSDIFSFDSMETDESYYTDDTILPFLHVSRYFHIDHAGLAYGDLKEYKTSKIKVIDRDGQEFLAEDGSKRYKIFLVNSNAQVSPNATSSLYRIYVFLDLNPDVDELHLAYEKVEVGVNGGLANQEINYRELINPRPYFKYVPEESDVSDHSNLTQKIYSSKPSNLKQQILGIPSPNNFGWKYFVPRKAIPDPRIFQLFRWRIACEFNQPIINDEENGTFNDTTNIIRAGVVVPPGNVGNNATSRANFLFYQLNETDYNFSKIKFVNPINDPDLVATRVDQQKASYWHVDIGSVTLDQLSKFDVLIWAPTVPTVDVSRFLPKISYFTENVGGTFIFETSANTIFTGIPNVSISPNIGTMLAPATSDYVLGTTIKPHDATASDPNDVFSSYGMWKHWPPNVGEIVNTYKDMGTLLTSADVIAGWTLDATEKNMLSAYNTIPHAKFQYATSSLTNEYSPVIQAMKPPANPGDPLHSVVMHKRFNSGGNIFVSTGSFFEDHLLNVNGTFAARTMQVNNVNDMNVLRQANFTQMVSAQAGRAEMKFRLNVMLYATVNKPAPIELGGGRLTNQGNVQSTTIYSDWVSDWVINPLNGVLSPEERAEFNFVLLPTKPSDTEPTWQRILNKKTYKQLIQEKIKQLDPNGQNPIYNTFEGAEKRYFIMVTNPLVQVHTSDTITADSLPTAWTHAYTPAFEVPYHLGSYVVRDELVNGTGTGTSSVGIYPPEPYDLQASASYVNTTTVANKVVATINLTGSLKRYVTIPPRTETRRIWVPGTADRTVDVVLHWNTNGSNAYTNGYQHMGYDFARPLGIDTWSNANYQSQPITSFPYWGWNGRYGQVANATTDNRGLAVVLIQQILNQWIFFARARGAGYNFIPEDGIFGPATTNIVREFQNVMGAKSRDGVVDAETWALLGNMLVVIGRIPGAYESTGHNIRNLIDRARSSIQMQAISDDNPHSYYIQISNQEGGPDVVSETFSIAFNEVMPIYKVSIIPFLGDSRSNSLTVDWLDIVYNRALTGYNFTQGAPGPIYGKSGSDGSRIDISFPELRGNQVIFRVSQSGATGYAGGHATSRLLGLRDVTVYAKKYMSGTPGYYVDDTIRIPGSSYEETKQFSFSATVEFQAGVPRNFSAYNALANRAGITGINLDELIGHPIAYVKWDQAFTISPPELANSFTYSFTTDNVTTIESGGLSGNSNTLILTYNGFNNVLSAEQFVKGPRIGNGVLPYYTKNRMGVIDPYQRKHGWVSKTDGYKLICKADGSPYGFPAALPSGASTSTHFARYTLASYNTDQTLYYGFYDLLRDEFITNAYGEPEITYYDYIRRGPQNVFICVMTTYELDTNANVPGTTDVVSRPFKWAMPVYGITTGLKSKIQLEALSPDLGVNDLWALPVKTGSFARQVALRNRSQGALIGYLNDYQGSVVSAYYDVPEARKSAWSAKFGRPYVDIKGETPLLLDDATIKVRQAPILINQVPTKTPSLADPWQPEFKVYRRDSISDPWVEVPLKDIKDYDTWTGVIVLREALTGNDSRLVKVDYTTDRRVYLLKHDGTNRINLNPYVNDRQEWVNKPLYIYLLPEYVEDANNTTIPESVRARTIQLSETSSIFNPNQVDYNPLAVLLGIIYISNSFSIDDLVLLDTRRRGGGVSVGYEDRDIIEVEPEADSYWDVAPVKAAAYQRGGFVIVRLPAELKNDFTYDQIQTIIERNITAGVAYKVEDLQGNRWE